MKRTALFFGSFNPIHVGHLIIANTMLQQDGIDEACGRWLAEFFEGGLPEDHAAELIGAPSFLSAFFLFVVALLAQQF